MSRTPREIGTLVVVCLKARNLPNKRHIGKQDPYCCVAFNNERQRTRAIKRGGQHPEWDEEVRFTLVEDNDETPARPVNGSDTPPPPPPKDSRKNKSIKGGKLMELMCYADDPKEPELIGETTVDLSEVLTKGETDDWFTILNKGKFCGEVYLEMTFWSNERAPEKKTPKKLQKTNKNYGGPGSFVPSPSEKQPGGSPVGRDPLPSSLRASSSLAQLDLYIPPYERDLTLNANSNGRISTADQITDEFGNLNLDNQRRRESYPPPQRGYAPRPLNENTYSSMQSSYSANNSAEYIGPSSDYTYESLSTPVTRQQPYDRYSPREPPQPGSTYGSQSGYDYNNTLRPSGYSPSHAVGDYSSSPYTNLPTESSGFHPVGPPMPSGFHPMYSSTPAPSGFHPHPSHIPHSNSYPPQHSHTPGPGAYPPPPSLTPGPGPYPPMSQTPVPMNYTPPGPPSSSMGFYQPPPPSLPFDTTYQQYSQPPASAPPLQYANQIAPLPPPSVPPHSISVPPQFHGMPPPPQNQQYAYAPSTPPPLNSVAMQPQYNPSPPVQSSRPLPYPQQQPNMNLPQPLPVLPASGAPSPTNQGNIMYNSQPSPNAFPSPPPPPPQFNVSPNQSYQTNGYMSLPPPPPPPPTSNVPSRNVIPPPPPLNSSNSGSDMTQGRYTANLPSPPSMQPHSSSGYPVVPPPPPLPTPPNGNMSQYPLPTPPQLPTVQNNGLYQHAGPPPAQY